MFIVYKTTNIINQKIYIGVHEQENDDDYLGSGLHLKRAVRKYGKENFKRETLYEFSSREDAFEMETYLVNKCFVERGDTYNMKIGGKGAPSGEDHHMYGKTHTEEARLKISKVMSVNHPRGMLGKEHTEDTKLKISGANKGKVLSESTKEKIKISNTGKKVSEESKQKMSLAKKGMYDGEKHPMYGKNHKQETKDKISKANKGRTPSKETLSKMSEKRKGSDNPNFTGYWHTPEGVFDSCIKAGNHFGCSHKTITSRCRNNKRTINSGKDKGKTWEDVGWFFVPT